MSVDAIPIESVHSSRSSTLNLDEYMRAIDREAESLKRSKRSKSYALMDLSQFDDFLTTMEEILESPIKE